MSSGHYFSFPTSWGLIQLVSTRLEDCVYVFQESQLSSNQSSAPAIELAGSYHTLEFLFILSWYVERDLFPGFRKEGEFCAQIFSCRNPTLA